MKKLLFIGIFLFFNTIYIYSQEDCFQMHVCVFGDCINGPGQLVDKYNMGYSYKGNFLNGCKSGYGEETFVDRQVFSDVLHIKTITYKGNWKNNKRHGQGVEITQPSKYLNNQFYYDRPIVLSGIWEKGEFKK